MSFYPFFCPILVSFVFLFSFLSIFFLCFFFLLSVVRTVATTGEMLCLDDIGRDSWDWVGPPTLERARFNSPEWGASSSPVKNGASPDCIIVVVGCCFVVVCCSVLLLWLLLRLLRLLLCCGVAWLGYWGIGVLGVVGCVWCVGLLSKNISQSLPKRSTNTTKHGSSSRTAFHKKIGTQTNKTKPHPITFPEMS